MVFHSKMYSLKSLVEKCLLDEKVILVQ